MASIKTRANAPKVSNWTTNQSVTSSSWTTVWSTPADPGDPLVFIKAVFQLDTYKMLLKVTVGEDVKLDVDLEELDKSFQLDKNNGVEFPIMKYQSSNLWIYCPSDALAIASGEQMIIEMKATTSKTKKLVRGMSEWGGLS